MLAAASLTVRQLHVLDLGAAHAHVVRGHLLRGLAGLVGVRADPDHALAQVGAGDGDVLEIERLGLGAARTGGDHDPVDALAVDVVPDHRDAFGVAQEVVFAHQAGLALAPGDGGQFAAVEPLAQAAALADIGAYLYFVRHCLTLRCGNPVDDLDRT